ncbi:hypothetical protein ABZ721_31470 [Streptomyces sp. NPDC006733]|uniref:hypothetical protein n=1 Tax=Streptomyces sp. NPDC006733 TaxID=3155460 RepID=UPI0033D08BAB
MERNEVPGPNPEWVSAASCWPGNPNPAVQFGMWWYVSGLFHIVAGLAPSLESLAARLCLTIEHSWEDLGSVDVAMLRVGGVDFALHRLEGSPCQDTLISVSRSTADTDAAIALLLDALGIGREALTFVGDEETGYTDLGQPGH